MEDLYHKKNLPESVIMNVKGQVMNVLPLIPGRAKKSWLCDEVCKIYDSYLIKRYQKFLEVVNTYTLRNVSRFLKRLKKFTLNISNIKLGHTHSCYTDPTLCNGMFLPVQLLSSHFPKIRNIRRLIYKLSYIYRKMLCIDTAVHHSDMLILVEILQFAYE